MDEPEPDDLCDEPLVVEQFEGGVILMGPMGVALAMTAEAAETSAARLAEAAREARQARSRGARER